MFNLKVWVDSETKESPLILIIPGFMNETSIDQPLSGWYEQITRFANEHSFSAGGIYWESGNIVKNRVDSLETYKLSKGLLSTWKDSLKKADKLVLPLRRVLKEIDRPIILVGHSLGGRIALKIAEKYPKDSIQSIVALAPAYENTICRYDKIESAVKRNIVVCHSNRDMVLQSLFSMGQNSKDVLQGVKALKNKDKWGVLKALSQVVTHRVTNPALGVSGIPRQHQTEKFIVQDFTPLGHLGYSNELYKILCQFREQL